MNFNEPTTQELIESCTTYMHDRFNYDKRMEEVSEQLALNPDALDEALVRFMNGDILALRLTLENAARAVCERSAQKLIKAHSDKWQEFYERDEFECDTSDHLVGLVVIEWLKIRGFYVELD